MKENPKRKFTTAVFVVHQNKTLMIFHKKLQRWLPPGGKIHDDELPEECAVREVKEETGVDVILHGSENAIDLNDEVKLMVMPDHMQLEKMPDGSYNMDFVYFSKPQDDEFEVVINDECEKYMWMSLEDLKFNCDEEIAWNGELALQAYH